jgi:hypothetical protein
MVEQNLNTKFVHAQIRENEIGSFLFEYQNNQLQNRSVIVYDNDLAKNGMFKIGLGESSITRDVLTEDINNFLQISSLKIIRGSSSLNILNYKAFDFEQLNSITIRNLVNGRSQKILKFNVNYQLRKKLN